jgi:hypothetical protein
LIVPSRLAQIHRGRATAQESPAAAAGPALEDGAIAF